MDSSEALSAVSLAVTFVILAYASVLDLRTRRVPNRYMIGLSVFGLAMIVARILADEAPLEYLFVLVPVLAILSDIYMSGRAETLSGRLEAVAKYSVAIISMVIFGALWGTDEYAQHLLAVPVVMLVFVALYMLDAIRGGADAKALIALAVVFPFYPSIGQLPLISSGGSSGELVFPFAFVVLITAAITVAVTPLGFLAVNFVEGRRRLPQALFGRVMSIRDAQRSHVWLMERMEDGRHVLYTRPKQDEDILKETRLLQEAGHTEVWVTPKIPFIVPMLIAFVFAVVVGNLLALLFPM